MAAAAAAVVATAVVVVVVAVAVAVVVVVINRKETACCESISQYLNPLYVVETLARGLALD